MYRQSVSYCILTKRYCTNAHSVPREVKRSPCFPLAKDNSSTQPSQHSHLQPFVTSITRECAQRLCFHALTHACWEHTPCIRPVLPVRCMMCRPPRAFAPRHSVDHLLVCLGLLTDVLHLCATAPERTLLDEPDPGPRCDRRDDDDLRRSCYLHAWWCRHSGSRWRQRRTRQHCH